MSEYKIDRYIYTHTLSLAMQWKLCSKSQTAAAAEVRCEADGWCLLVTQGLPWVVPCLGVSRWEHQLPEDGGVERTEDPLVEVDDSPKGRPQLFQLGTHQPEGRGQLGTAFSVAGLQHGLEGGLHPLSCVCWGGRDKKKKSVLSSRVDAQPSSKEEKGTNWMRVVLF